MGLGSEPFSSHDHGDFAARLLGQLLEADGGGQLPLLPPTTTTSYSMVRGDRELFEDLKAAKRSSHDGEWLDGVPVDGWAECRS